MATGEQNPGFYTKKNAITANAGSVFILNWKLATAARRCRAQTANLTASKKMRAPLDNFYFLMGRLFETKCRYCDEYHSGGWFDFDDSADLAQIEQFVTPRDLLR